EVALVEAHALAAAKIDRRVQVHRPIIAVGRSAPPTAVGCATIRARVMRMTLDKATIEEAAGRSLVVMFTGEEDSWLVWGTALVVDGELLLDTTESEHPVPLPGGADRLARSDGDDVFEDAEFVTAVVVQPAPEGGLPAGTWRPGLRLADDDPAPGADGPAPVR
ncbi:MAG: hypothetical protein ACTHN0_17415, partial [Aquihabitans sp.]